MNRLLLALAAIVLTVGIGACFVVRHEQKKTQAAEIQAQEHKGKADAYAEQARQVSEAQKDADTHITDADATVAKLRSEVARMRKAPVAPDPSPNTPSPDPEPAGQVVDLGPVVARLDALVAAQDVAIKERDRKILLIQSEADSWHKAHDERQAQVVQLEAALAAQKGLAAGQLWRGRIQGFAVGATSGYVAGRLR